MDMKLGAKYNNSIYGNMAGMFSWVAVKWLVKPLSSYTRNMSSHPWFDFAYISSKIAMQMCSKNVEDTWRMLARKENPVQTTAGLPRSLVPDTRFSPCI